MHAQCEEVAVWLLDRPGALIQLMQPVRGTSELVAWVVGPAFEVMKKHYPIERDLMFVLDLSLMQGRSAVGRSMILDKARELHRRISRVVVVPPLIMAPMYLQSLRVSFMLLRSLGIVAEFANSSVDAIERFHLRPLY